MSTGAQTQTESRLCQICNAPLDGVSRFWCKAHYCYVGKGTFRVSAEMLERLSPRRGAFTELLEKHRGNRP